MNTLTRSILLTIAYADIFDCALSEKEIHNKLQSSQKVPLTKLSSTLSTLTKHKKIQKIADLYCFPQRSSLPALREKRLSEYQAKLRATQKIAKFIGMLPLVEAIFLTGSVAAKNCDPDDDIDLLIITRPNSLWLVRIWCILIAEVIGRRRRPEEEHTGNKFCFNMFLETTSLGVESQFQDIYTAHEVIQASSVFKRHNVDSLFRARNNWVSSYFANVSPVKTPKYTFKSNIFLSFLNKVAFKAQLRYMNKRLTREKITLSKALFHPRPTSQKVQNNFSSRKKRFKLV
jgi:hypothetical protein